MLLSGVASLLDLCWVAAILQLDMTPALVLTNPKEWSGPFSVTQASSLEF